MEKFRYGCGAGADWQSATAQCAAQLGRGGTLGFVYVTDRLADHFDAIVDALRPMGVTDVKMPATPENVWRAIQGGAQ